MGTNKHVDIPGMGMLLQGLGNFKGGGIFVQRLLKITLDQECGTNIEDIFFFLEEEDYSDSF